MERFGLRDNQWDRIKDILQGHVGGTAPDNRLLAVATSSGMAPQLRLADGEFLGDLSSMEVVMHTLRKERLPRSGLTQQPIRGHANGGRCNDSSSPRTAIEMARWPTALRREGRSLTVMRK
jgi:hypothetical protein